MILGLTNHIFPAERTVEMKNKFILTASLLIYSNTCILAQKQSDVEAYISKYKELAIAEQKRTGVPAAIKLAQGIHESGCGSSELSLNARNHFGIKCKNSWTGAIYTYSDDAKDECFRSYDDDISSYRDHSDFLKNNKRYASLFTLDVNDYKGWAQGLKNCGYATNPKYAQRIVDLIEKYQLDQYSQIRPSGGFGDNDAADEAIVSEGELNVPAIEVATVTVSPSEGRNEEGDDRSYYTLTVKNGLKGFYGRAGDLLLNAAYANNIRYAKLLDLNDLPDEPLPEDMFIYLEKKHKEGQAGTYQLKDGERLITVAQEQGMRLKELRHYNHLRTGEEPEVGTVLHLKQTAPKKPLLRAPVFGDRPNPDFVKSEAGGAYVAGGAKPAKEAPEKEKVAGEHEAGREAAIQQQMPKDEAPAVVEETFNIANEVAVEEQIAAERSAQLVAAPSASTAAPQAEMSELERLKAKLDRSVYGNGGTNTQPVKPAPAPQVTTQQDRTSKEVYQTRPASAATTGNDPVRKERSTDVGGGGIESLKRRIEAHQNSNDAEGPVVANRSNENNARPAKVEPARSAPKATAQPTAHTVKRGETATAIAAKYGLTVKELIRLNRLPANGAVKTGQKLKLK